MSHPYSSPKVSRRQQIVGCRWSAVETINNRIQHQMKMWHQGVASNNRSIEERCKLFGFNKQQRNVVPNHNWKRQNDTVKPCTTDTVKQGSIVATAKTKMVYRPVPAVRQDGSPLLDKNGKQVIWFNKMGLQNIVTITSYGKTIVFKKMQKAQTIRDLRDNKSKDCRWVRAELTRLLGLNRGLKGFEFLTKIGE